MRQSETRSRTLQSTLTDGLERYGIACAAVAAVTAAVAHTDQAEAAIIYSGTKNAVLTDGSPGIYINLVTNAVTATPSANPGWDINPYVNGGTSGTFFAIYLPAGAGTTPNAPQLVKSSSPTAGGGDVGKLTGGTLVGPSSTFIGQPSHFGFMNNATAGDWVPAGTGYMGIVFTEAGVNGGNPLYGWVQIAKTVAGEPPRGGPTGITFVDWAYDNTGAAIAAGNTGVPEPSSLALLAAGATGLMVRRGRAKLRQRAEA